VGDLFARSDLEALLNASQAGQNWGYVVRPMRSGGKRFDSVYSAVSLTRLSLENVLKRSFRTSDNCIPES